MMICRISNTKYATIIDLKNELTKLKKENNMLKKELNKNNNEINTKKWAQNIDSFVDRWHEKNKDDIDIGVIDFKFFKLDIFPDFLEKHIYKKVIKIIYSFFVDSVSPEPSEK